MKVRVLSLFLLIFPVLASAQSSHPPGYYFFYSNGLYYPDYQFPHFNAVSGARSCDHSCHNERSSACSCGVVTGSRSDPYYRGYGEHFYRVYNREGLSVEYYSPD